MIPQKAFWWGSSALSLLAASILVATGSSTVLSHLLDVISSDDKGVHQLSSQNRLKQPSRIYAVAVSPNGKVLATGSYNGKIYLWNLETQSLLYILPGHTDAVETLAFAQDSQVLLSGSWDNDIKVWDLTKETPVSKTLQGHIDDVQAISISIDGQTLVSGSYDGTVKVWDLNSGKATQTLKSVSRLSTLALHSNKQIIAIGNAWGNLSLWDLQSSQIIQSISGHSGEVRSVSFSPDGSTLVSGSYDKTVKLWHVSDRVTLSQTLSDVSLSAVLAIAISPDGRTLVSGGYDGMLCFWEMDTGKLLGMFPAHRSAIWSIAFSPDSKKIISGSSDTTVSLWKLSDIISIE
ncbi:MAG: WD40 repeat domain-containing protein [Leptolyngbyaceae cyanobacterium]